MRTIRNGVSWDAILATRIVAAAGMRQSCKTIGRRFRSRGVRCLRQKNWGGDGNCNTAWEIVESRNGESEEPGHR